MSKNVCKFRNVTFRRLETWLQWSCSSKNITTTLSPPLNTNNIAINATEPVEETVGVNGEDGCRGEEVAAPLKEDKRKLVTGVGVLKTISGEGSSKIQGMYLKSGKVKGKMKSDTVPVEVLQPKKLQSQPWKSVNKSTEAAVIGGLRTYKEHAKCVVGTYKRKKNFYLTSLQNTNFVHQDFKVKRRRVSMPLSVPSVLGITEEEMQSKIEAMMLAGFTDEEAWSLVWGFPQCVSVNWNNLYRTVRYLMGEAGLSLSVVAALVEKHPYIFTRNSDKVISGRGTGNDSVVLHGCPEMP